MQSFTLRSDKGLQVETSPFPNNMAVTCSSAATVSRVGRRSTVTCMTLATIAKEIVTSPVDHFEHHRTSSVGLRSICSKVAKIFSDSNRVVGTEEDRLG